MLKLIKKTTMLKYILNLMLCVWKWIFWNEDTCSNAAEKRHLKWASWMFKIHLREWMPLEAKGHIECLKYAHKHWCPWNEVTYKYAAISGQMKCLKYVHKNKCPWDEKTCSYVASNGHIDCLKYVHENGCPWGEGDCVEMGSLECLKYVHENGCPRDKWRYL